MLCRYGAAIALGVACSGTGLKEAVALLETLSNDPVSYVRQGALIASALVLIQQNDCTSSRVAHFRQLYAKVSARTCIGSNELMYLVCRSSPTHLTESMA